MAATDAAPSTPGDVLPKDAVCCLDVPLTETSMSFTKAVDRLVGDAVAAREAARPKQPAAIDAKTGQAVQLLEGKANLLRLKQEIPLTDDEVAAVDDGLEALEKLCAGLADVPAPASPAGGGATPRRWPRARPAARGRRGGSPPGGCRQPGTRPPPGAGPPPRPPP